MGTAGTVHGLRKSDLRCLLLDRIWLTGMLRGRNVGYFTSAYLARRTDSSRKLSLLNPNFIFYSNKTQHVS